MKYQGNTDCLAREPIPNAAPTPGVGASCAISIQMYDGSMWRIHDDFISRLEDQFHSDDVTSNLEELRDYLLENPEHRPRTKSEVTRMIYDACQEVMPSQNTEECHENRCF